MKLYALSIFKVIFNCSNELVQTHNLLCVSLSSVTSAFIVQAPVVDYVDDKITVKEWKKTSDGFPLRGNCKGQIL